MKGKCVTMPEGRQSSWIYIKYYSISVTEITDILIYKKLSVPPSERKSFNYKEPAAFRKTVVHFYF